MVATIFSRALMGDDVRPRRVAAVTGRNLTLLGTGGSYSWLVLAGFAESALYLLAIGWGVGALVGDVTLPDGTTVSYLEFVAPALLASSAMNGSLAEATISFFAKLRYWKHYDAVLNTPVTPADIASGELGWAVLRGAMYSTAFLLAMVIMSLTTPPLALLALPAALLIGFAFGALGLAFSAFMRDWQDFEYSGVVQFALFVFSGTFVPLSSYPAVLRVVIEVTPLYQGVSLIRGITVDKLGSDLVSHIAYLVGLTIAGLAVASRGMRSRLRK